MKERLKRFSKANPEVKVLLIRSGLEKTVTESQIEPLRQRGQEEAGIAFYAALAEETERRLYRFELGSYQELLELELEGFLSGGGAYEAKRTDEQLALVCTNGRRDLCCARFRDASVQLPEKGRAGISRSAGLAVDAHGRSPLRRQPAVASARGAVRARSTC